MENQWYKVGKHPNTRVEHNRRTWAALESRIRGASATFDELVDWCEGHKAPGGGRGFVKYCIDHEWLVPAGSAACKSPPPATEPPLTDPVGCHLGQPRSSATGVYIAYPTSHTMKPIYRGLKTMVNDRHTKVGITKDSFASRSRVYEQTFDGEVVFLPIAEVPAHLLDELERHILLAMERRYQKVGRAREWFDTNHHDTVTSLVKMLVGKLCG
jgi:hypothetical protein